MGERMNKAKEVVNTAVYHATNVGNTIGDVVGKVPLVGGLVNHLPLVGNRISDLRFYRSLNNLAQAEIKINLSNIGKEVGLDDTILHDVLPASEEYHQNVEKENASTNEKRGVLTKLQDDQNKLYDQITQEREKIRGGKRSQRILAAFRIGTYGESRKTISTCKKMISTNKKKIKTQLKLLKNQEQNQKRAEKLLKSFKQRVIQVAKDKKYEIKFIKYYDKHRDELTQKIGERGKNEQDIIESYIQRLQEYKEYNGNVNGFKKITGYDNDNQPITQDFPFEMTPKQCFQFLKDVRLGKVEEGKQFGENYEKKVQKTKKKSETTKMFEKLEQEQAEAFWNNIHPDNENDKIDRKVLAKVCKDRFGQDYTPEAFIYVLGNLSSSSTGDRFFNTEYFIKQMNEYNMDRKEEKITSKQIIENSKVGIELLLKAKEQSKDISKINELNGEERIAAIIMQYDYLPEEERNADLQKGKLKDQLQKAKEKETENYWESLQCFLNITPAEFKHCSNSMLRRDILEEACKETKDGSYIPPEKLLYALGILRGSDSDKLEDENILEGYNQDPIQTRQYQEYGMLTLQEAKEYDDNSVGEEGYEKWKKETGEKCVNLAFKIMKKYKKIEKGKETERYWNELHPENGTQSATATKIDRETLENVLKVRFGGNYTPEAFVYALGMWDWEESKKGGPIPMQYDDIITYMVAYNNSKSTEQRDAQKKGIELLIDGIPDLRQKPKTIEEINQFTGALRVAYIIMGYDYVIAHDEILYEKRKSKSNGLSVRNYNEFKDQKIYWESLQLPLDLHSDIGNGSTIINRDTFELTLKKHLRTKEGRSIYRGVEFTPESFLYMLGQADSNSQDSNGVDMKKIMEEYNRDPTKTHLYQEKGMQILQEAINVAISPPNGEKGNQDLFIRNTEKGEKGNQDLFIRNTEKGERPSLREECVTMMADYWSRQKEAEGDKGNSVRGDISA